MTDGDSYPEMDRDPALILFGRRSESDATFALMGQGERG